jgi:hypothetical protein
VKRESAFFDSRATCYQIHTALILNNLYRSQWLATLLFGKPANKMQIDLGDLQGEKERLSSFLHSSLKVDATSRQNRLALDSDEISSQELQRVVNKFVYRRNLNGTHWVSLEGSVVKINKFKNAKKPEKIRKNPTSPRFAHGF